MKIKYLLILLIIIPFNVQAQNFFRIPQEFQKLVFFDTSVIFLSPNKADSAIFKMNNGGGKRTYTLPTQSGTFVVKANAPLVIDATTGTISDTGTGTGTGGGYPSGSRIVDSLNTAARTFTNNNTFSGTFTLSSQTSTGVAYFGTGGLVSNDAVYFNYNATNHILNIGGGSTDASNTSKLNVGSRMIVSSAVSSAKTLELIADGTSSKLVAGITGGASYGRLDFLTSNSIQATLTTVGKFGLQTTTPDSFLQAPSAHITGNVKVDGRVNIGIKTDTSVIITMNSGIATYTDPSGRITTSSIIKPTWQTSNAVNGTPKVDSLGTAYFRIKSTFLNEPNSSNISVGIQY